MCAFIVNVVIVYTYIVTVKTGNRWAADTEADLYLIMHGETEKTEKLILRQEVWVETSLHLCHRFSNCLIGSAKI